MQSDNINKNINNLSQNSQISNSNLPVSSTVQALDNVLSYLDKSADKICLAEAQGLGFLMNPRLREILAVHDQLKNQQKSTQYQENTPQFQDFNEVFYQLQQENVSFGRVCKLKSTLHIHHHYTIVLFKACPSFFDPMCTQEHIDLPKQTSKIQFFPFFLCDHREIWFAQTHLN